jgi:hypothetical protein
MINSNTLVVSGTSLTTAQDAAFVFDFFGELPMSHVGMTALVKYKSSY